MEKPSKLRHVKGSGKSTSSPRFFTTSRSSLPNCRWMPRATKSPLRNFCLSLSTYREQSSQRMRCTHKIIQRRLLCMRKKRTTSSRSRTTRKRSTTTSRPSIWRLFPPQHETVDKGHGRIETRRIWTSTELKGYIEFPYHEQVVRIGRPVTDLPGNQLRHEVVSGITSLTPEKAGPERLLQTNPYH